jgi:hypothetical protein
MDNQRKGQWIVNYLCNVHDDNTSMINTLFYMSDEEFDRVLEERNDS